MGRGVLHAGAVALAILAGVCHSTIASETDRIITPAERAAADVDSEPQIITVDSDPQGAQCEIYQGDRLVARIDDTPDVATVDEIGDDLFVKCRKGDLCRELNVKDAVAASVGLALLGGIAALFGADVGDVDVGDIEIGGNVSFHVVLQEC